MQAPTLVASVSPAGPSPTTHANSTARICVITTVTNAIFTGVRITCFA